MDIQTYQIKSRETAVYPNINSNITYPSLGLIGEIGELSEKFKKVMRDNGGILSQERIDGIIGETGDLLWYLCAFCTELKINIENMDHVYTLYKDFSNIANEDIIIELFGYIAEIISLSHWVKVDPKNNKEFFLKNFKHEVNTALKLIKLICERCNTTIEDVMDKNIEKLKSRKERNVICGDGDTR